MIRNWNLGVAVLWLAAMIVLLFRESLLPDLAPVQARTGLIISGAMIVWNVVRWLSLPSRPTRQARIRREAAPYEYNPELDFQKMEREQNG
jgi:hypothetical protein